jgi:hypothetical protein
VRDGFRLRDFACPGEGEGLGGGDDEDQAGLADVA